MIEVSLHFSVPKNQMSLSFGVLNNQISLHFDIPDNKISLHFGVPDNCLLNWLSNTEKEWSLNNLPKIGLSWLNLSKLG